MKSKILNLKNPSFVYKGRTYSVIGISQLWGVFPGEKGCANAIQGWKWIMPEIFENIIFLEVFKPNGRQVKFDGSPLISLQDRNALQIIQSTNFGDDELKNYVVDYAKEYIENIEAEINRFNQQNNPE